MTTDMGKHKNKDLNEEEQLETAAIADNPNENIDSKPKKKSKKKKERTEVEESMETEGDAPVKKHNKHKKRHDDYSGSDDVPKKSKKKRKHVDPPQDDGHSEGTDVDAGSTKKIKSDNHEATENEDEHVENANEVAFPHADLSKLLDRIEAGIPSNDTMSFKSRLKRINWEEISFDDHSAEKCQSVWQSIQKCQRQHRLLREMISDAKEELRAPSKQRSSKNHPDYPKRPLTAYMLYHQERKRAVLDQNPGMKVPELAKLIGHEFSELPEETKQRYSQLANKKRAEYEQECEEFYEKHPDVPRASDTRQDRREMKTRKPTTPFNLFLENEIKNEGNIPDKSAFKETCKERWRNLADKSKLIWIDWALDLENKFQEEIRNIQITNPNYEPPPTFKNVLTKEEKQLKERMSGKPEKPPNSAYSLFSRIILKSDKLKNIDTKERMRVIANDWKNLPQDEKDNYRDETNVLMEQYKVDYAVFLDSLSADERAKELQKAMPKRRLTKAAEEQLICTSPVKKVNKCDDVMTPVHTSEKDPLLNAVTPQNWSDMKDNERSMYMKYVIKLKDYIDAQHQKASRTSDSSSSSDSQGDSDSSPDD